MSNQDLEIQLRQIGRLIDVPPTPDVAARFKVPRHRERARLKVAIAVAALFIVGFVASLLVSPRAREAVADLLGFPGVKVTFGDPSEVPRTSELDLGERMSLAAAQSRARFEVRAPQDAALGPPDEVYYDNSIQGVSLLWLPKGELESVPSGKAGLIITQLEGRVEEGFMKKILSGSKAESVEVEGEFGLWIYGRAHQVWVEDGDESHMVAPRLAGNTLLWERNGITYRLESWLDKDRSIQIARSLR